MLLESGFLSCGGKVVFFTPYCYSKSKNLTDITGIKSFSLEELNISDLAALRLWNLLLKAARPCWLIECVS